MREHNWLSVCLSGAIPAFLFGAGLLAPTGAMAADCTFAQPLTTQTKCVTAVVIPGNPLRSFDISFVNPDRNEYYLADRSNSAIDVIDTETLKFKRFLGGFVGIKNTTTGAVDNKHSGPDGVATHGRWLYAGDGNSTLRIFDLDAPPSLALKDSISTGGTTRVDEMALTTDGRLLLATNNAEDPPYATLFAANGDDATDHTSQIIKITIDPTILPAGFGLSIEQTAWDPKTRRFYTSVPVIANNPSGCNYGQLAGPISCDGGLLVTDPTAPTAVYGAFNLGSNTGVVPLHACGPNGATVGPHDNLLLGCTPQNNPNDTITLVINAKNKEQTPIKDITGSDEVWFNRGDRRYYLGASRDCTAPGTPCPSVTQQTAVLGVIDAKTNLLIEKIPQSSNSHSVAADSENNRIFVPQVAPVAVVGSGGDTTNVGAGICGTSQGCVAVYQHKDRDRDDREAENDEGEDRDRN
jgi:DNA-binding beta-propeller fold protein YncE